MKCRDGHDSTTTDYCSECGIEMAAQPDPDATPVPGLLCPTCTTERDDPSSPFCGVCGYNFVTKVGGHVVSPSPPVRTPPPARTPPPVAAASPKPGPASRIEIEVTFDESNPAAPKGQPVRRFSLYDEENLMGRRSSSVAQTIGLDGDDFLSRRHLLIIRQRGGYVARLFDNTNGGTHAGVEMRPGVEVALSVGDVLTLGSFTIIRVTAIR
jgi:hypothetical protein